MIKVSKSAQSVLLRGWLAFCRAAEQSEPGSHGVAELNWRVDNGQQTQYTSFQKETNSVRKLSFLIFIFLSISLLSEYEEL